MASGFKTQVLACTLLLLATKGRSTVHVIDIDIDKLSEMHSSTSILMQRVIAQACDICSVLMHSARSAEGDRGLHNIAMSNSMRT